MKLLSIISFFYWRKTTTNRTITYDIYLQLTDNSISLTLNNIFLCYWGPPQKTALGPPACLNPALVNAIKPMLFYYRRIAIFEFFHKSVCCLLLRCMLKATPLRVGVKTLYNAEPNTLGWFLIFYLFSFFVLASQLSGNGTMASSIFMQ